MHVPMTLFAYEDSSCEQSLRSVPGIDWPLRSLELYCHVRGIKTACAHSVVSVQQRPHLRVAVRSQITCRVGPLRQMSHAETLMPVWQLASALAIAA
jgi:hypothetical protein